MKYTSFVRPVVAGAMSVGLLHAQVLSGGGPAPSGGGGAPPAAAPAPQPAAGKKKDPMLGNVLPFLDPGSETATWDGKIWNITDNRIFQARFEKYLGEPEANGPEDQKYREVLEDINSYLMPTFNGGHPDLPSAVAMLPIASTHPIDAHLCDTMANSIYGVWLGQKNVNNLKLTTQRMERERNNRHFFGEHAEADLQSQANQESSSASKGKATPPSAKQQAAQLGQIAQYTKDIIELEAKMKANDLAMGTANVTAKAEFQAIILQFAAQRRFEHVVMACRFYRHIFADPSGVLHFKEGSDVEKMFASGLGTTPTVSGMDAFANEMIRDVDQAIQSFDQLIARGDLASATKRLSEAFMIGEYLPRVRRVPSVQKLKILDFTRDANQLVSAIEVKDFTLAEQLVIKLKAAARDFDASKPQAAIETARMASDMTLSRAKFAAMQGDPKTSAEALKQAAEYWPTNPKLKEFNKLIDQNTDEKSQAILDLDRLLSQRDYRQIFNDQGRYAAAVKDDTGRQEQLRKVLIDMNRVNLVIAGANANAQQGNTAGAWETVEKAYQDFPNDPEVARLRADLSVKATDFVSALQHAKTHEELKQTGSALAWYLKAKGQYQPSQFAMEGINRLVEKLHNAGTVVP